jgi:hypothetical protein
VALIAFTLAAGLVVLFQSLTYARSARLECERGGAHACVLVREYGPIITRRSFPLDGIRSVEVRAHPGKGSTSYSVDLTLIDGTHEQLSRNGKRARAELDRTVIADFLEGRAVSPATTPLDEPSPLAALAMAAFAIGIGAFSLLFFGSARLEFDLDRGTIRYTRSRFPLRPLRRSLRAEDVVRARLTARPGSKGSTIFGVSLDLRGGEVLSLVPSGGSNESRPTTAVEQINTLLAKTREER